MTPTAADTPEPGLAAKALASADLPRTAINEDGSGYDLRSGSGSGHGLRPRNGLRSYRDPAARGVPAPRALQAGGPSSRTAGSGHHAGPPTTVPAADCAPPTVR